MNATRARECSGRARWGRSVLGLLLAGIAALAGLSTTAQPAAAAAGPCPKQEAGTSPVTGLVAQAHPVILVHGWEGGPMTKTRSMLEKLPHAGWQFLLFDYSAVHDRWAARPEIAACLATYIATVSQAQHNAGGDGKVYLVAHSMGGLAVAYAANPGYGLTPGAADDIGGLITIDTPWTGSPWGGTAYAQLWQALAGVANLQLPGPASDAATCLRRVVEGGAGGCSTPAFLPRTVPVTEIGGDITVRRTFFGLHAYDLPLGSDTVVPLASQQGYLFSAAASPLGLHSNSATISCSITLDSMLARAGKDLGRSGGWAGTLIGALAGTDLQLLADGKAMDAIGNDTASPALIEFLAAAYLTSPCAHTNMPKNPDAITQIMAALRRQAAPQPLTPTDLLRAPVPADCDHPAGQLVDGSLPLPPANGGPDPGFATVVAYGTHKFLVPPVIADVNRDGTADLAGVLLCSAGGVSWPEVVLIYASGLKLLGYLDLASTGPAEHEDVLSMRAAGGDLQVTWRSYEGAGFDMHTHTGTIHWDGRRFIMQGMTTG